MPREAAEELFLSFCGSRAWAAAMAANRPYAMLEPLFEKADRTWSTLTHAERLDAFSVSNGAHPTEYADDSATSDLREAYRLYRNKFGFIFILHTSGKSAVEVLAICRARLGNSIETELTIAAEEQRKITQFRLSEFLET